MCGGNRLVSAYNWFQCQMLYVSTLFFFFFSSRRRHTRCREVSWARRCVQETAHDQSQKNGLNRVINYIDSTVPIFWILPGVSNTDNYNQIATNGVIYCERKFAQAKLAQSKVSQLPSFRRSKDALNGGVYVINKANVTVGILFSEPVNGIQKIILRRSQELIMHQRFLLHRAQASAMTFSPSIASTSPRSKASSLALESFSHSFSIAASS
eukprot:TRINITY_DN17238_c0_g1_i3.p1 TRINITY_DN17238_c0_g1~~TRINITY_DN17238_c0_g1_i3.p1  ORF type:complete len:211 (+),score=25.11 TRINITY_DN17238_c0_g1_i3:35-667(+)